MKSFYSTKVHRKVQIPDEKVCGYTIRNGVVPEFMKTRKGKGFSLQRPGFRAGTMVDLTQAKEIRPNFRNGLGNREIIRPNFEASKIVPRQALDFDKLQALDIESQGAKVQLSDETLGKLLNVDVPDVTDLKWLAEKARLEAEFVAAGLTPEQILREIEVNKPLGRKQRTTKETRNIGQSNLSMGQKLAALEKEIKDGRAESRIQQAQLIGQFALVLNDTREINALTRNQLTDLGESLSRLGIPTTPERLGLPEFIDNDYYNVNTGLVNLLLFSKVGEVPLSPAYNYDLMVRNFVASPADGLPAMKLSSAILLMHRQLPHKRFLDLASGGVISLDQLRSRASEFPDGFENPVFSINPVNR